MSLCPVAGAERERAVVEGFAARMQRLAPLQTMRCRTRITVTLGKDARITQALRVSLKRPDKLRLDVISCSLPMLQGWSYVRRGDTLAAYDPISERTVSLDTRQITERHPMRLDTAFALPAAMFDPTCFDISYQGRTTSKPVAERLRLRPRAGLLFQGVTIRTIDFLLDPETLAPRSERAWDDQGNVVFAATFSEPQRVAPGLVANMRMEAVSRFGQISIRFRWLGKALVPVYMRLTPNEGDHRHHGVMEAVHSDFELDPRIADREFELG